MKEHQDSQFKGFSAVQKILVEQDNDLREKLLYQLILPNYEFLRSGNTRRVGEEGWYSAFPPDVGLPGANPSGEFPVPRECLSWYGTETDPRDGLSFRFFRRKAWLDLAPPQRPSNLEFVIPYVLSEEVLDSVELAVSGIRVPCDLSRRDSFSRVLAIATIPTPFFEFLRLADTVRITLCCKHAAVPKHLYSGSTDSRPLSFAVSYPAFVDQ